MWENIERLRRELDAELKETTATSAERKPNVVGRGQNSLYLGLTLQSIRSENVDRNEVLRRIEIVAKDVVQQISQGQYPVLRYSNRNSWCNISFTEGVGLEIKKDASVTELRFESCKSRRMFALTMKVLAMCYNLIQNNSYSTKRDLFYNDTQSFSSQAVLDRIVDNISCMLKVPRSSLHVLSTSKGCIAGDLQYVEVDGNYVDCSTSKTGCLVPVHVNGVNNIKSSAKLILVVEKDASFQKLLDEDITEKLKPCILITGRGFPDLSTRQMLRKLWDNLHIPVLALVDADPHGLGILFVYKFGSKSLSLDSHNLTVPSIRWLGILPSDLKRLHVPTEVHIPLVKTDLDKAQEIMKRPYYSTLPLWMKELQIMLDSGVKAEIQSLASISSNFLTDVYIPNKIRYGGWI